MPPKRPRIPRDATERIKEALAAYLETPVKISVYGPKQDKNLILRHKKLFVDIHSIQPNLSLTKLSTQASLREIALEKPWKMSADEAQDFACKVEGRVRTMCRHLSQAMLKTAPPTWVATVFDSTQSSIKESLATSAAPAATAAKTAKTTTAAAPAAPAAAVAQVVSSDDDVEGEEEEEEEEEEDQHPFYFVGWDTEQMAAWRLEDGKPKSHKTFTKDLFESANATDEIYALPRLRPG